jgi:mediator of RNA polymerase II transcription subunit 17
VDQTEGLDDGQCDLIHSALYALLLRQHRHRKIVRLGTVGILHTNPTNSNTAQRPPVLRPIIDFIQYQMFCSRLQTHLTQLSTALSEAQILCRLRFEPVGDMGRDLVSYLSAEGSTTLSGEAVLRVDHRYVLRLSLASPSTLIVHLPQVTQTITSMPQLHQLIADEFERYLLTRICELGKAFTQDAVGSWFVDLVTSRCIGKLEGQLVYVLSVSSHLHELKLFTSSRNFSVLYQSGSIQASAFQMSRESRKETLFETYSSQSQQGLFDWVDRIAKKLSSRTRSDISE